jgi:hypothetical protein
MMNLKQILIEPFKVLENKTFARFYMAQTISVVKVYGSHFAFSRYYF